METLNLILDLSRIEAGKLEINIAQIDIVQIVHDICQLFYEAAVKKSLYLRVESNVKSLVLQLDEKLFREAINNLVNNAIKYSLQGGVTLKIYEEQAEAGVFGVIDVIDTGIGISETEQAFIWEEFRQVSEGIGRKFEGTGLGLTITKKFVEKMHGTISVQSKLNYGSIFTVKFPVGNKSIAQPRVAEISAIEETDISRSIDILHEVLYVEDDPVAAGVVKRMLHNVCSLDIVANSQQAIEKARNKQYKAILMDINLGHGPDGLETARSIREIDSYNGIPVIAVTAFAMVGDREEFLAAGCTDYISKPFKKKELIDIVRKAIT